jgi:predicted CXXCH cytochrome family protein
VRRLWLIVLLFITGPVLAGETAQQAAAPHDAQSTLMPHPAKGKGESCVAPTDWMRRNHMKALLHQRDMTVHEGVRGTQFSLKDCVSCHAVKGEDGRPVTISSPKHFCRSCHDYAAVSIDCFECHASTPAEPQKAAAVVNPHAKDVTELSNYLKGIEK